MDYHELLREAIFKQRMKIRHVAREMLEQHGVDVDPSYISCLQNGKRPPASDKINDALAAVLGIDPLILKVAAYKTKIPQDVLDAMVKEGS